MRRTVLPLLQLCCVELVCKQFTVAVAAFLENLFPGVFLRHPDRVAAKLKWERSTHAVRRYIGHTGTYSFIVQMQLLANRLNVGVADRRLKLLLQGRHTQYTVLLHGACR